MTEPFTARIRANDLTVDHSVQRPFDKRRADSLVPVFRPDALGVVVVSSRKDGTQHIIDGQHRVGLVKSVGLGDTELNCLVYEGLSQQQEAAMFRHLNETKRVQVIDKFRVRVIEGDLVAVRLNGMLDRWGWHVSGGKRPNCFAAVAALEKVYTGAKIRPAGAYASTCEAVISIVTSAWGHNSDGVRNELVLGLGMMLLRYGGTVDGKKLTAELAKFEGAPLGLVGQAKGLARVRHVSHANAMADLLTNIHNKGRRINRLPEWKAA